MCIGKLKVYLDNCCFNRPFDDQTSLVVNMESIAKLYIQSMPIEKTANKIAYLAGLYKQPSSKESSK